MSTPPPPPGPEGAPPPRGRGEGAGAAPPAPPSPERLRRLLAALEEGLVERGPAVRFVLLAALAGDLRELVLRSLLWHLDQVQDLVDRGATPAHFPGALRSGR